MFNPITESLLRSLLQREPCADPAPSCCAQRSPTAERGRVEAGRDSDEIRGAVASDSGAKR